jgi:hypothetical protein
MARKYLFREVIRPPFWLISFLYFMLFSLVLAIWAAFDDAAALNAFAIAIVLGLLAMYMATTEITVDGSELRIKRAHIELRYIGEATIIDKKEFAIARTRGADPAAYFALTFWISKGVRIEIEDPRDPTPYWLISTKRAAELKAALERNI